MREIEIVPLATMVAQLPAGQKSKAIQTEDGSIYIPMFSSGSLKIAGDGEETAKAPKKGAVAAADAGGEEQAPATKGRRGAAAAASASAGVDEKAVKAIFTKLDAGEKTQDEAAEELAALAGTDKDKKKAVAVVLNEFLADETVSVEAVSAKAVAALSGGEVPAAKTGRLKKGTKPAEPEEIEDVKTLKVGDKVQVYLGEDIVDADAVGWYPAVVETAGRKGLSFKFEDDEEIMEWEEGVRVAKA